MKVTVTHMKAPWPAGSKVGSVVEIPGSTLPGWAQGKCTPATDGAKASHTWEPPKVDAVEEPAKAELPAGAQQAIEAAVKAAVEPLQALVSAQAAEIKALKTQAPEPTSKKAAGA